MRTSSFVSLFIFLIVIVSSCKKEMNDVESDNIDYNPTNRNVLLIIADDVGMDPMEGTDPGILKALMPNLMDLAQEGVTFDQVWTNPTCSPSRAAIISGKYGHRTGVLNPTTDSELPVSETILQEFIWEHTNSDYSQGVFGKWHLSGTDVNGPSLSGIEHFAGLIGGGVQNYSNWNLAVNGDESLSTEYCTSKFTDMAIEWINDQNKPWFCWMAYTAAHDPFHLPPQEMHSQGVLPEDQASIDADPIPYYLAMIESIDHELGRILDSIPSDELENTVVIFIGDNGTPGQVIQTPYTSNRAKGSLHQGGIHVPMVISGSGVSRENEHENALIGSVDLFASISEIIGLDVPTYEDSKSFIDLLSIDSDGPRQYNYTEALNVDQLANSGFTIRNAQYKLILLDSGQEKFYDLLMDPYEEMNLMMGGLSDPENEVFEELMTEANRIRE